jgi:hypothetical protein
MKMAGGGSTGAGLLADGPPLALREEASTAAAAVADWGARVAATVPLPLDSLFK